MHNYNHMRSGTYAAAFVPGSRKQEERRPVVALRGTGQDLGLCRCEQSGLTLSQKDPKMYSISKNGIEAAFHNQGVNWTIIGANAPIVSLTKYPTYWPIQRIFLKYL